MIKILFDYVPVTAIMIALLVFVLLPFDHRALVIELGENSYIVQE